MGKIRSCREPERLNPANAKTSVGMRSHQRAPAPELIRYAVSEHRKATGYRGFNVKTGPSGTCYHKWNDHCSTGDEHRPITGTWSKHKPSGQRFDKAKYKAKIII